MNIARFFLVIRKPYLYNITVITNKNDVHTGASMAESKHYGRQIVGSLVLTIIILGAVATLFGMYLIPKYQISREQIYNVAVKVFPLVIGLVMIQIGTMVASRRDEDYADEVDKLPPNAYDKALYREPKDDQPGAGKANPAQQMPVVHPVVAASPVQTEAVSPAVQVSQSSIATPVGVPETETIDATFDTILENELKSAQDLDYDLTLMLVKAPEESHNQVVSKLSVLLDKASFPFDLGDGTEAFIFPFYNQAETEELIKPIEQEITQENPSATWTKGFASRNGRVLDTEILVHEAQVASGSS
jgi:hypothetical protein